MRLKSFRLLFWLGPPFSVQMLQNVTEFEWTSIRVRAAEYVAEDLLTDEQISANLRIARMTLTRWKTHPAFIQRVAEIVEAVRAAVLTQGIADKVNRVKRLDTDWKRMQSLVLARAAETERDIPGASTGLVVRSEKETKYGRYIEHSFDASLMAELRATEQQAAKELGQWSEKTEHSGSLAVGTMSLDNCSGEELRRRLARAAATVLSEPPDALRD